MNMFAIRHKATGQYMPLFKRRGYSHWNPSHPKELHGEMKGTIRLATTAKQANQRIVQWACNPNLEMKGYTDMESGYEGVDLDTKDDGRKKEDLEIVPVTLVFGEPLL